MAYTEAQRAALEKAYMSGVTEVEYDGRRTRFRTLAELKQLLDEVSAELDGDTRRRRFLTKTNSDKGL